eukprot:Gb_08104 [translate_table: standard]
MGIVERIKCDPNFPSQIALVGLKGCCYTARGGLAVTQEKSLLHHMRSVEPTNTTIDGLFLFSSLPERVDEMKDIFLPTLSSPRARRKAATSPSSGISLGLPRIVVARENPTSSTPRMREELRVIKMFSLSEV